MQIVHIYAEADTATPKNTRRMAGYVLEYVRKSGKVEIREEYEPVTGTYHAVILQMLIKAASRIQRPCELHVHTQDGFVLECLVTNLPGWATNGYKTRKGTLIKNCREWQRLWELIETYPVVKESGLHERYTEMRKKMDNEKAGSKNPSHSGNTRKNGG